MNSQHPLSLHRLCRYAILKNRNLLLSLRDVVVFLSNSEFNTYEDLGALQVVLAQARGRLIDELGITMPSGRGQFSVAEQDMMIVKFNAMIPDTIERLIKEAEAEMNASLRLLSGDH